MKNPVNGGERVKQCAISTQHFKLQFSRWWTHSPASSAVSTHQPQRYISATYGTGVKNNYHGLIFERTIPFSYLVKPDRDINMLASKIYYLAEMGDSSHMT